MSEIFSVVGIAIIACSLIILLKQSKPELALAVLIASGIIILMFIFGFIKDILSVVSDMADISGIDKNKLSVLLKCAGICFLTKAASETCSDFGQSSLSSKVDIAGKIMILIVALPFFKEVIDIIKIFMDI